MSIHTKAVRLQGVRPLLMSNGRMADPNNPIAIEISKFDRMHHTKKTRERAEETDRLRWLGQVYADHSGRVIIPRENLLGCLVQAGRHHRLGTKVASGVWVTDDAVVEFKDSDKVIDELVLIPDYTHRTRCRRGVMLTRPYFPDWSADFVVEGDDRVISKDDFDLVLDTAGAVGIGAWAARYGKFEVKEL